MSQKLNQAIKDLERALLAYQPSDKQKSLSFFAYLRHLKLQLNMLGNITKVLSKIKA